jgi:HD-GYP domain-containing protein (c-di-GMP phosphodiesterase class II)
VKRSSPGNTCPVESAFLTQKRLQFAIAAGVGALVAAGDQIARSESLAAEWWVDLPLAVLVATLVMRAAGRREDRSIDGRPVDALDEVVLAVSRGRHVHEVLESLTRQACRIMHVERAVVVLRDQTDPRSAIVVAGYGVPPDYVGQRIGIDEGMAGHVITTGEPVLVDDYGQFPRRIGHAAGAGLRAGAAVPIRREGIVLGALAAGTTHFGRRFGAEELEALLRLAELGAVAVEQASMREELERAVEAGVEAMAAAVDMRDDYTGAHSEEVVRLARVVGERMGLAEQELGELEFAARLHDVGKIGVPDAVLRKEGPLEGAEWEIMRQHPAWGADMLCRVPGLKRISRIVRHAHERWDGDGYPDQLRQKDIPLPSRIIFACDAYNAMTSDRPYRDALRPWVAVSELREGSGGQFDPDVVDALVGALREQRSIDLRLFQPANRGREPASV